MLDAKKIETYRDNLLARRDELRREREHHEKDTVELDQSRVGRVSRMDALQQHAMQVATGQRQRAELTAIGGALERIDADTFGWCLACGEAIAPARLDFNPAAALCIACADRQEQNQD